MRKPAVTRLAEQALTRPGNPGGARAVFLGDSLSRSRAASRSPLRGVAARSALPNLDPLAARKGCSACEEDGEGRSIVSSDPGDVPGGFGGDARIPGLRAVQGDDAPSIGTPSVGMRREERLCWCLTLS